MGAVMLAVEGAQHAASIPVLPALVILPAIGALLVLCLPRSRPEQLKLVAAVTSVAVLALSLYVLYAFDRHDGGFQFVTDTPWIRSLGISWHFGVDGISLFLVVLTGLMFAVSILGVRPDKDPKSYYFWILVLEIGCLGAFLALDLFVFFVMFELVLVPMYMLIGGWGHGKRVYAATKFFLYTMFGSAFMLVAIVALVWLVHAHTGAPLTFDLVALAQSNAIAEVTSRWLFLAFALAFAIKVPVFPLHTWLPDAHTEAPTAGSVLLAAIMLKLGTYGLLRFGLYLFPKAAVWAAPGLIALGVVGIIYGAIAAAMQKDLKRLVAYSSVAHMGFVVMGIFVIDTQGIQGSVLQMVNHGITTGALFLLVGMIYDRRHTREIAKLKGLQKVTPVLAGFFMVVMLSSIGVPGLNGFVGEFLILLGTFTAHRWFAVVAASGVILAALYLLWAYQRVFHGEPDEANESMTDLTTTEKMTLLPLVALIVFLGVYPKPVLERISPAVDQLIAHVEEQVPGFKAPNTQDGEKLSGEAGRAGAPSGSGTGSGSDTAAGDGATSTGAGR